MPIDNSKFEGKIRLLRRLVSEKKNIGIELIDILDDEKAISYIHESSKTILKKMLNSYTGFVTDRKDDVFISLVLIALLHYDSNYYNSIEKIYADLYNQFSEQKIEGTIRSVISLYKNDDSPSGRTRIINTVLKNTIVPQYYLPAFFEFIFDIYKINFECELPDELEEEFQFIYEGLKGSLDTDGDELKLKVTKKSYKLIKSTKMLVSSGNIDALIKLSIIIVRLADKYYWDLPLTVVNPYLQYGFEKWARTLREKAKDSKREKTTGIHSRWEPKFILNKDSIFLLTPVHRIKSDYDYRDIIIEVKNGNEIVYYNDSPDIRAIIGGYQIPSINIPIDKPAGMLEYSIKAKHDIIYKSEDKLYRKWIIVFNDEGEEISNNTDYEGNAFFCVSDIELNMNKYYQTESYKLYEKVIRIGDVITQDSNFFNFSTITKPGIFGEEFAEPVYIEKEIGGNLKVYKRITNLVIECDSNINRIEIFINDKIHKLSDYKYKKFDRSGTTRYIIELTIKKAGIYSLLLKLYTKGKVIKKQKFEFVVDRNLKWNVQKIDASYYCLLNSDLIGTEKEISFIAETYNKKLFEFEKENIKYRYLIPLNIGLYSLDGIIYHETDTYIWCEDIKTDTDIYFIDYRPSQLLIKSSDDKLLENIDLCKDRIGVKASIGALITWKSEGDYVDLNFVADNKVYSKIRMYNRCVLDKDTTELLYDESAGELITDIRYWGKGDVRIEVLDGISKVFASDPIQNKDVLSIPNIKSFKKYCISIIEKKKSLLESSNRELYRFDKSFVAWKDLVDKTFRFNRIYFDQEVKGEFVRKLWYFNNTYLKILEYDKKKNTYSAEIFVRLKSRKIKKFHGINPVNVELCSSNIDGEVELAIDKDGDGLLLDFDNNTIMNTLFDDKATDIFSYILNIGEIAYE